MTVNVHKYFCLLHRGFLLSTRQQAKMTKFSNDDTPSSLPAGRVGWLPFLQPSVCKIPSLCESVLPVSSLCKREKCKSWGDSRESVNKKPYLYRTTCGYAREKSEEMKNHRQEIYSEIKRKTNKILNLLIS